MTDERIKILREEIKKGKKLNATCLTKREREENWEYVEKKEGEYLVVKINASQRKYVVNINGGFLLKSM